MTHSNSNKPQRASGTQHGIVVQNDSLRGFRCRPETLAIIRSMDEQLQELAQGFDGELLPFQLNAKISPRMISTARKGKSLLERMLHNVAGQTPAAHKETP